MKTYYAFGVVPNVRLRAEIVVQMFYVVVECVSFVRNVSVALVLAIIVNDLSGLQRIGDVKYKCQIKKKSI